ncbi:hypothetical protein JTB14_022249 [Gonioctena quinquepunctata]|nr:hypothetical protein JTB14_022249 [Gonioctena quinquepunctata]
MDSRNEDKMDIDPDYVRNNTALRKAEEKEKESRVTPEKLSKVISDVFDEELLTRQKQLEDIEEKICKAQKLLHLVRYVLVTSYYNKKSLEISTSEENTSTNVDNQNRIHPALKKLLGNNAKLDVFTSGKRRNASKICDNSEASTSQASDTKKLKLDNKIEAPKKHHIDRNQDSLKNRRKTQHRLVIGNISKWMPSSEDDNTTHKWMMYVRGEKENPDISHIVEKVIFYLHPSYRPHDVVQVVESPFHLSRRGWGEFPLRVQIFFKCSLNKPISIVHNLKLDKTYTGRQTLGNETIVDVYLHDDNELSKPETITKPPDVLEDNHTIKYPSLHSEIKIEDESTDCEPVCNFDSSLAQYTNFESDYLPLNFDKHDSHFAETSTFLTRSDSTLTNSQSDSAYGHSDTASMSFEHDYCQDDGDIIEDNFIDNDVEMEINVFLEYFHFEHSYSLPVEWENTGYKCEESDKGATKECDQGDNKLIFGVDDTYLKGEYTSSVKVSVQPKQNTPNPLTCLTNGYKERKLVTNLESLTITPLYESSYKVTLPQNKFKSIGEALPFLFKRFLLWNELAIHDGYRTMYPFVATSREVFKSWNIGKQLNSEWNRAKEVKKILLERFPMAKKWNTKAIFMYGRSHGYYCPLNTTGNFFEKDSKELALINNCFTETLPNKVYAGKKDEADVNIDIVSNGDMSPSSSYKPSIDISDVSLKNHCAFVREAALDCGIILKTEEVAEGVIMNGAERMILEAVKCLAEGLIRRSKHHSNGPNHSSCGTEEITEYEIKKALNERSEFRSIKEFQMKKREIDFFT